MKVLRPVRLFIVAAAFVLFQSQATAENSFCVSGEASDDAVLIAGPSGMADVLVGADDWWGVSRAAGDLCEDVKRVTGMKPDLYGDAAKLTGRSAVIVGTLGKSALVDGLVQSGKLDAASLTGRWESFILAVVEAPMPSVDRALVIAGSDRRGTIYGIYTLSEKMGVSPWYWWADVHPEHRDAVYASGSLFDDGPTVKYRGIFLNDEAPSLTAWANERFGGFNHKFYEHVFELLLRLKANYLWPAMWGSAFNEDDPENPRLADAYGIVMGTSHHEPMLRAQKEWWTHGTGSWNYEENGDVLRQFWADGIARNKDYESIVTIGMRGDGDEAMSEETNVALLERIVSDQREILERETGRKASDVPQLWALYKEVQDYYEHGMRVPDDVTLLWCDDNWGNIRRLPLPEERKRSGGAGIYYHFDYVGGPRSYKWVNTYPLAKVWQQMYMAWQYEATQIWIVNVGDLKPMEYPLSFFLDYAWDPAAIPFESLHDYSVSWAAQQFGNEHAEDIAELLEGYTQMNSLRKPELLGPDTFSLLNYNEAGRAVAAWKLLKDKAQALEADIPEFLRDAYFQLVSYPVVACANLTEMYVSAGYNRLYAAQGRAAANEMADVVTKCFDLDAKLAKKYNTEISLGFWNHMMDQKHIGWTYWQQPPLEVKPAVSYVHPLLEGALGVAVEGGEASWPENDIFQSRAKMPPITPDGAGTMSFEVFNRGLSPVDWSASLSVPWLRLEENSGTLASGETRRIRILSSDKPLGESTKVKIEVQGKGPEGFCRIPIELPVLPNAVPDIPDSGGFVETGHCFSINASQWQRKVDGLGIEWCVLPGFAPDGHSIPQGAPAVTAFPVVHPRIYPGGPSPRLEYNLYFFESEEVSVELRVAPTLDFLSGDGINVAVSFDDEAPQVLRVGTKVGSDDWAQSVSKSFRKLVSSHNIAGPGWHVLKLWYMDPGVVFESIAVDAGGIRPSCLGPVDTMRVPPSGAANP